MKQQQPPQQSPDPDPESAVHELLFKQLRDLSQDSELPSSNKQEQSVLQQKLGQWEASYSTLREVQGYLARAYHEHLNKQN